MQVKVKQYMFPKQRKGTKKKKNNTEMFPKDWEKGQSQNKSETFSNYILQSSRYVNVGIGSVKSM